MLYFYGLVVYFVSIQNLHECHWFTPKVCETVWFTATLVSHSCKFSHYIYIFQTFCWWSKSILYSKYIAVILIDVNLQVNLEMFFVVLWLESFKAKMHWRYRHKRGFGVSRFDIQWFVCVINFSLSLCPMFRPCGMSPPWRWRPAHVQW